MIGNNAGRSGSKGAYGVDVYPHTYFDPSSSYIPPTIKEAYRWCTFLFITNSVVGTLIRKKSAYVVTGLNYDSESPVAAKIWKEVLQNILRIREFEYLMTVDHEVFGNAFCSIIYPFDRYLKCSSCGHENFIKTVPWTYTGNSFIATCKECKARTTMSVEDRYVRNRLRMKLHRWFPDYIEPKRNPVTGTTRYILRLPKHLKARISNPKINKVYVEDTPKEILQAIATNKVIELDPRNIYHWKMESISMEDDSLGIPPLMNVIKDIWLNQVYKKGQESVALEHIHPLTLLSPAPPPGGAAPHMNTDLLSWKNNIQNIITLWRRDPTAMFPVPFPVQTSQIRGDAQALSLHNDLTLSRQDIAGGLDVPADFLYGNLTWSGGNVSLRVLENLFINRLAGLDRLLTWVVGAFKSYLSLPDCEIKHKDFKMADDVAQKNIALTLRASGTISDQTVLDELDFDYYAEKKKRAAEQIDRMAEMERQAVAQAEIDAKVSYIRAKGDLAIQEMQQKFMMDMQTQQGMTSGQPGEEQPVEGQGTEESMPAETPARPLPGSPEAIHDGIFGSGSQSDQMLPSTQTQVNGIPNQAMVDMQANNIIKTTPPDQIDFRIATLQQQDPVLAQMVKQKLATMKQHQTAITPLPEQKPPTRGPETAMI